MIVNEILKSSSSSVPSCHTVLPVVGSAEFRRRHVRELEPLHGTEVLGGLLVAPLDWVVEDVAGVAFGKCGAAQGGVRLRVEVHHREEDHVRSATHGVSENLPRP